MPSVFDRTYLCEQGLFFPLKVDPSKLRSQLTYAQLKITVRVVSHQNISPDFEHLVGERNCQTSGT